MRISGHDYIIRRSLAAAWRLDHEGWGRTTVMAGSPVKIPSAR